MSGRHARELARRVWQLVAAPSDMEVGPNQEIVETIDGARRLRRYVEHVERCADRLEGRAQRRGVGAVLAQAQQGVTVLDAVVHRHAGLDPGMGQAGARPGGRDVFLDQVRRAFARFAGDDRRVDVAVAELRTHHGRRLGRLHRGDGEQMRERGLARGRVVGDIGPIGVAPDLAAGIARLRRRNIAPADLAALDLVGGEQLRSAPSLEHCGELPGEIDGIADAHVHAEAAEGRMEMAGVAGNKHPAIEIVRGQHQALRPAADMQGLVADWRAHHRFEHARHVGILVDDRVDGEMLARILDDQHGPVVVDAVVVARARHGHAIEQVVAAEQRLP